GHATSAEAHDLYLQGLYQYSLQSPASYKKARQLMQRAIEKDPNYVNAYLALARVEVVLVHITAESPDEGLPRAREALEKALAIDPQNAEAHGQLASVQYIYGWDWPHAEQEFRTAIAHGAQAPTRSAYGWSLGTRGRFAEAHQQLAIAQELDPLGIGPRGNEVMVYMLEHNYEGGKRILRGIMDRKPDSLDAHLLLGLYAAIERNCAAATDYANWDIKNFQAPASLFEMALSSACHADLTQSRKYLEQMAAPGEKGGYVSPYQIALGYAYIGDKAQALDYLSQSMAAKEGQILYIKYDPIFDGIRSDPRFRAMEQRAGLD
ncbi:MAG TPA: hypothetical protein VKT49_14290, partial [Bryobacteraceae bacterium]|nr:hypothetical protein [Bryobacteraceae bacterium]